MKAALLLGCLLGAPQGDGSFLLIYLTEPATGAGSQVTIAAGYLDPDGTPIPDRLVVFNPVSSGRLVRGIYLEVGAGGDIIGGAYFGGSRNRHPDFLWNPRRLDRGIGLQLRLTTIFNLISSAPGGSDPEDSTHR